MNQSREGIKEKRLIEGGRWETMGKFANGGIKGEKDGREDVETGCNAIVDLFRFAFFW